MIDKCRAELQAIRKGQLFDFTVTICDSVPQTELLTTCLEFPDSYVRLCQFHVVQAILRWDRSDGSTAKGPKISTHIKYKLLILFRRLQRCRSWTEWPAAKAVFLHHACELIHSQRETESSDEEKALTSGDEGAAAIESDGEQAQKQGMKMHRIRGAHISRDSVEIQWQFVEMYFCESWFTDEWIGV